MAWILDMMDFAKIQKTLFLPAPHSPERVPPCDDSFRTLIEMAALHPDRFAFLRGGENLNPLIYQVVHGEVTLEEAILPFVEAAKETLRAGAVGFGEMAAEHFSFFPGHSYESAPPDHPLFLLLADIAADYDVPIDLHMEAISSDIDRIQQCNIGQLGGAICRETDNPNPEIFKENITAFERLLRYNRDARIIWVHAGWDNTGHRTVELMRQLLADHPNLYIQLRPLPGIPNRILFLDTDGQFKIRPPWLELISDFRDRFIVGLDSFYGPIGPDETPWEAEERLVRQLSRGRDFVDNLQEFSEDLARKVAYENAIRIYQLDKPLICHKPGTPAEQVLRVSTSDLADHLGHGDTLGPCI